MFRILRGASRVVWLVWLLAASGGPVRAQAPALIRPQPASLAVAPGQSTTVAILVEGATDLYGVQVHLAYDPAVVQVVDGDADQPGLQAVPGDFLHLDQGFTIDHRVDNESGAVDYAFTLLAPAEPVSGDGVLLSLTLRGVAEGNSLLTLATVLASADGLTLPVESRDGSLTVGGATPSATRSPAADPPATTGQVTVVATRSTDPTPPPTVRAPSSSRSASSATLRQPRSSLRPMGPAPVGDQARTDPAQAQESTPYPAGPAATAAAVVMAERPATREAVAVEPDLPTPPGARSEAAAFTSSQESARSGFDLGDQSQQGEERQPTAPLLLSVFVVIAILTAFLLARLYRGRPGAPMDS
ncbi:MAG: cohesin domain-containing protein [Candidatus Promineifilaceae bacterium]|nr:cohesin domain-containing protein [Candidatus Promineifilaceae bacterium]